MAHTAFPLADATPAMLPSVSVRFEGESYWLGFLCRTLSFPIPSRFYPGAFPDFFFFISVD